MSQKNLQAILERLRANYIAEGYGFTTRIARGLGVSRQHVNRWLSGRRPFTPDFDTATKLQKLLR